MKGNFDLFQEAARQLEDKYFQEKLEQVRTASNVEGRQWLIGLMRDLEKWRELTTQLDGGMSFSAAIWQSHSISCY